MVEREKVIKALEKCSFRDCPTCPYYSPNDSRCIRELIYDALTLLKEQETVEPVKWVYPTDVIGFGRCPHCNSLWDYSLISNMFFKHCPRCGQAVKRYEID